MNAEAGVTNNPVVATHDPEHGLVKWIVRNRKMMRLFLIGMLCGVMVAATFTYVFAIPANNYYWQSEIYERGGAAWTVDMKSGRTGWKWLVEPKAATPGPKRVTAPAYKVDVQAEQL